MEQNVLEVLKKINAVSKKIKTPAYVVGGFVRDCVMGKSTNKDIDIVVEGSGLGFGQAFDVALKQTGSLVEFPDFDTARYVLPSSEELPGLVVEFAGARSEQYHPTTRKPVVEKANLQADLSRRDFTVNAMAIPVAAFAGRAQLTPEKLIKKIIDPFNGQQDLTDRLLCTPLEPDVTFSDDPLRMLRAVRFAAQLHFAIDPGVLKAIHHNRERIKIISGERVQEELLRLLGTDEPSIGFILLFQSGLLDLILPEISALDGVEDMYGHQHKNNLIHTFKVVDNIAGRSENIWLRFAGLLHDIGKPATKRFVSKIGWTFHAHEHVGRKMVFALAKRLRLSRDHTDYLAKLVRWHMQPIALMDEGVTDSAVRRLIVSLGEEINDLLILGRSDITTGNPAKKERRLKNYEGLESRVAEVIEKDKLRAFQSPLRGEEIMALAGLKPGPTVGKIKEAIEEAILDGIIPNEYEPAKEYFARIKDQYLAEAAEWERLTFSIDKTP